MLDLMVIRFTRNLIGRHYDGLQRIINNWNSLPHEIITSPDVLSFKTNLDFFCILKVFHLYDLLRLIL